MVINYLKTTIKDVSIFILYSTNIEDTNPHISNIFLQLPKLQPKQSFSILCTKHSLSLQFILMF